nr:MAG: ORF1 [Torque teno midi virus]
MPFWWNRRRKFWLGRRRFRRRTYWPKRRKRYYKRRRTRRPARRRRRRTRRKYKVRRKKQSILVRQWQPDSIVRCKIKGLGCLVAGAEGRQFFCYTNEIGEFIQPKAPGGGGFGVEVFSLEYLYTEWVYHRNIWTKSNDYKDLCRYLGTKIIFYRHPTTDFVVAYSRMPPFFIHKYTYSDCHPVNLLLARHKKIILSQKSHPTGKLKVKLFIKPPKQMLSKWFFQKQFATAGLFQIQASAMNQGWAMYGPNTQSRLITLYTLNTLYYTNAAFGRYGSNPYLPFSTYPAQQNFYYDKKNPNNKVTIKKQGLDYNKSTSWRSGFFQKAVLNAWKVTSQSSDQSAEQPQNELPVCIIRYNPDLDDGTNSRIWFTSIHSDTWQAPTTDKDLFFTGRPLWMLLFGAWNYVLKTKNDKNFLQYHMLVIQSDAIRRVSTSTQKVFPLLDFTFTQGDMPYGEYLSEAEKAKWYPTCLKQQEAMNGITETGPYIPKYSNLKESTWELKYSYTSYFKWGGPEISNQPVQDPQHQEIYDVPDKELKTIQIVDPLKQDCKAMLRAWDVRRGIITDTALRRMQQNLSTSESDQSSTTETSQKKRKYTAELPHPDQETKKIKTCILSLYQESTCQEEEQDIHKLIQLQQQQQQQLKKNILNLLLDLKIKQRMLQLNAGIE